MGKNNVGDEEWEQTEDYIKEKKGKMGNDDRNFLFFKRNILDIEDSSNTDWFAIELWKVHKRFLRWVKKGKWGNWIKF